MLIVCYDTVPTDSSRLVRVMAVGDWGGGGMLSSEGRGHVCWDDRPRREVAWAVIGRSRQGQIPSTQAGLPDRYGESVYLPWQEPRATGTLPPVPVTDRLGLFG